MDVKLNLHLLFLNTVIAGCLSLHINVMNHLVTVIAITALHWGVVEAAIEVFISDNNDYTYSHHHNKIVINYYQ